MKFLLYPYLQNVYFSPFQCHSCPFLWIPAHSCGFLCHSCGLLWIPVEWVHSYRNQWGMMKYWQMLMLNLCAINNPQCSSSTTTTIHKPPSYTDNTVLSDGDNAQCCHCAKKLSVPLTFTNMHTRCHIDTEWRYTLLEMRNFSIFYIQTLQYT